MNLLLTGFEPFGGSTVNPSMQSALALAGRTIDKLTVQAAILPVEARRMPAVLLKTLATVQPEAVLGLGEAPRRPLVSIERVAVNLQDYTIPDNRGRQVRDKSIRTDGPAAYFSTLPVRRIFAALQKADIPAELSLSAGAYLCNHLMYLLLDWCAVNEKMIPAGFIHLPSLPAEAVDKVPQCPSMALETSIKAVTIAIKVISENLLKK